MSLPILINLANPDPNANPLTLQELVDVLRPLLSAEVVGDYLAYVQGSATPAVEDQNKIWHRTDVDGRPLGTFKFYDGAWRRQYSGLPTQFRWFRGNPETYFDANGRGLTTTEWDGWHLCLTGDSEIELEDGSLKTIREIVENKLTSRVRCYDEAQQKFVSAEVTDWFKNEFRSEDFVRIRFNKGLQNSGKRSVTATKEHPFLTEMGWRKAGELITGDKVFGYEKTLTCFGKEALLGMWLGDGSYSFKDGRFTIIHGERQRSYSEYIAAQWGVSVQERKPKTGWGKGKKSFAARIGIKSLFPEFTKLVPTRTPHVTSALLNELSEVSLAFWYMDDGSLQKDNRYSAYQRACFHTQGFSDAERMMLAEYLEKRWGLTGKFYKAAKDRPHHKFLRLDADSSNKFFSLVARYMLPDLLYKLPDRFQAVPCVLKEQQMTERNLVLREVQVREFSKLHYSETFRTDKSGRYDIRVEGHHNFVANGFVVHNCNGNGGTQDLADRFLVGSEVYNEASGQWTIDYQGSPFNVGGNKEWMITEAQLPPLDIDISGPKLDQGGQPNFPDNKVIVDDDYIPGTEETVNFGHYGAVVDQTKIPTLPPFYAAAICQWVGYL